MRLQLVGGFWEGTVDGLLPGSYCVTVEGFVGAARDRTGQTCGIQVVAGRTAEASVTVTQVPVASVTVTPDSVVIPLGETMQLTATLRDANNNVLSGRAVTWTSSNNASSPVSQTGVVTAAAFNFLKIETITATSEGRTDIAKITVDCSHSSITLAQTISGTLANTDCRLVDGSYVDFYLLTLNAAATVQINLTSTAFDAYLFLVEVRRLPDGSLPILAEDDDGGGGTNSRITRTLAAGAYFVGANSVFASRFGAYQVSIVQQ